VKVHCIEFSITLSNYVTWQYTIHQFSDSVPIITMFIHQPLHIQCIFFPKGGPAAPGAFFEGGDPEKTRIAETFTEKGWACGFQHLFD